MVPETTTTATSTAAIIYSLLGVQQCGMNIDCFIPKTGIMGGTFFGLKSNDVIDHIGYQSFGNSEASINQDSFLNDKHSFWREKCIKGQVIVGFLKMNSRKNAKIHQRIQCSPLNGIKLGREVESWLGQGKRPTDLPFSNGIWLSCPAYNVMVGVTWNLIEEKALERIKYEYKSVFCSEVQKL